jgi:hypothetical protein
MSTYGWSEVSCIQPSHFQICGLPRSVDWFVHSLILSFIHPFILSFLVCIITFFQCTGYNIVEWSGMNAYDGLYSNLSCYPRIFMEELRNTTKYIWLPAVQADIRTQLIQNGSSVPHLSPPHTTRYLYSKYCGYSVILNLSEFY